MFQKKLTIFFLLIILPCKIFSQINIIGQIKNQNNKPVELIEIQLQNKDSIIVKSELTNTEGKFLITVEKGEYQLLIKQLGKLLNKQQINANLDLNIGIIKITVDQQQLQEVVVSSKKKLIQRKVDRLVFNVENSISASGGDAIDALKITPSIRVQNDKIAMIGKSNMSIMIDDKLIQLSGDDLINFLKTISSDNIKSIEVITTPPAKYDAEGNSGIVNIKLKKAKENSISGSLKTSYTQAKYSLGNIGGGINYQKDKLTIVSNLNYSNGSTSPYQEYTIYYPNYTWFEESKVRRFQNDLGGRIALDYQITPKTSIGLQYSGASNKPIRKGTNTSFITDNLNQLDSLVITPSYLQSRKQTHSLNFHSITKLDTIGKQISFDADYFNFKSNLNNNFNSNVYLANGTNLPNSFLSANNLSSQNISIYSSKADIDIPLKWINLSFGGKVSFINNDSDVFYFDTANGSAVLDPTKSNAFNYKENTQAIYVSGDKKLSEKWEVQLGLRLESTQTKGYSKTLVQSNTNNYTNLFPTFYLTYIANENSTFGLNYSKRIDRPTYSDLNPFRYYSTKYNFTEGNPFLHPFFTDNLEISHTYKNFYTSIYASYINNGFDQVTLVSPTTPVQMVIPYNFYKQITEGLLESYSFKKWKVWNSNNEINVFYSKTTSDLANTLPKISSWTTAFKSNNNLSLNKAKSISAELNFTYQSPSIAGSYDLSSFYYFDTGLKMFFADKKLQCSINIIDIFKTNKLTFSQNINGIDTKSYSYSDTQKIRFSLTYNFGKTIKDSRREQSNEDEKRRVK